MTKTSITIPTALFEEAKDISDNFSALATEAIGDYIRKKKVEKALKSRGMWADRKKRSTDVVNELRSEDGRAYANRSD
jgi:post-segregation antitoxin (ccd killing protein)